MTYREVGMKPLDNQKNCESIKNLLIYKKLMKDNKILSRLLYYIKKRQ